MKITFDLLLKSSKVPTTLKCQTETNINVKEYVSFSTPKCDDRHKKKIIIIVVIVKPTRTFIAPIQC